MRRLVLAAAPRGGSRGGGRDSTSGRTPGRGGGGRSSGTGGRGGRPGFDSGSGRGVARPDRPGPPSRREGRVSSGGARGRGDASRHRGATPSRRGANNPRPNAVDERGACDTMAKAAMSLELGHPRCPMCAQEFASGGTRARHLALCCPDLIDPEGWAAGDGEVVRRCAALRHPKASFRWAVLSRRFGWSDDDGDGDEKSAPGDGDDDDRSSGRGSGLGSGLGDVVSRRRRESSNPRPPSQTHTNAQNPPSRRKRAPMTAVAVARALRVDLATVRLFFYLRVLAIIVD